MIDDPIWNSALLGCPARVVYRINGVELFAIGLLISLDETGITMEQHADQFGPVAPIPLNIEWWDIIRLNFAGPAADDIPVP